MSTPAPVPTEAALPPVSRATISPNSWTPHSIVLRDTWFPLAHADAVRERPVRRAVYSHPYFLWREKGAVIAAEFHPHEKVSRPPSELTGGTGRHLALPLAGEIILSASSATALFRNKCYTGLTRTRRRQEFSGSRETRIARPPLVARFPSPDAAL